MFIGGANALQIERNVIDDSAQSGILFTSVAATPTFFQNVSATLLGNDITDNGGTGTGAGVRVLDDAFVAGPGDELEIHANRIFGNALGNTAPGNFGGGIRNEENGGTVDIDAINNWFGCNEGPQLPAGTTDCDDVVGGSVDAVPYLTFQVTSDPASDTVPNGSSEITGSYLTNSDGDVNPNVAPLLTNVSDVFPRVPVRFSQTDGPGSLVSGFPPTPDDPQTISTSGGESSVTLESDDPGLAEVEGRSDEDHFGVENQETDEASVLFSTVPGPPDSDSDGVPNAADNCDNTQNPSQANLDGDSQGDACDADIDNDGVNNAADGCDTQAANTADGCPAAAVQPQPQPSNVINGTAGNDTINGTSASETINCGDGDDVVNGGGGNDVINCGAGNDQVNGNEGNDRINGGSGNDRLSGNEGNDRVVAGSGNDRANGNSGRDRVGGQSGNDRVGGQSGNDRVNGENGNDRVSGGANNDAVSGGNGRDRVNGDSGRDRVSGGSSGDRCSGGSGNDRVSGNSGNDRLSGNSGNDRLRGGSGRDRLNGGSGNNTLIQ